MTQNSQKAPFDPGFAPHVVHFYPALLAMNDELARIKNFGQKKMRYKVLDKTVQKALQSTLGFWVGCILWGGYIKYTNQNAPKEISGNTFLGLSREDIPDFAYQEEFKAMAQYLETFERNAKYYTGASATLPKEYKNILEEYVSFIEINEHFLETRTTADIKIPAKFDFLAQYKDEQLHKLGAKIVEIIAKGDLSEFLNLEFVAKL